jgi:hypothetical protein
MCRTLMNDPRDYKLDIANLDGASPDAARNAARPFVSVLFRCCNVYQRIYRSADGTKYEGRCPKCARPVRFLVGEGGTSERFFVVE